MTHIALKKVLSLADHDDIEVQCSAIKVLSELRIKNKKVSGLLLNKLSSTNPVIKRYALFAIEKNPSRDYVAPLLDMLELSDEYVKTIETILCSLGSSVFPLLKKRFPKSRDAIKKVFITCIGSMKTIEARTFLLLVILDYPLEIVKHVCFSLRSTIESYSLKEKRSFFKQLKQLINTAFQKKNYIALTSYMILLGYLRYTPSKNILLSFVKRTEREYFHVQRNALLSLSKLHLTGTHDDIASILFSVVESGDGVFIKSAIDILNTITFSNKFDIRIQKLLQSSYPAVRRFAVICLGRKDTKVAAKQLVSYMRETDSFVRNAAVDALKNMPQAVGLLVSVLDTLDDTNQALSVAYILKEHKGKLTAEKRTSLFALLEKYLMKNNEKYKLFFNVLRIAVPEFLYKATLRKVQLLKRRKKFKEAERFVQLLSTGLFFTDEVKYESAVICLKNSSKNISLLFRNDDYALRLFEQLLKSSDIALIKRLKKESILDSDDLFYLGFHFSEKLFELRKFGIEILKYLIKKYPRSRMTRKAKKKVLQVGTGVV